MDEIKNLSILRADISIKTKDKNLINVTIWKFNCQMRLFGRNLRKRIVLEQLTQGTNSVSKSSLIYKT